MQDITYVSPHSVPESELLEEYERLLHANRLDLARLEANHYIVVPAGVSKPIAPEDPCTISERRAEKEMRWRWRIYCPGTPLPIPMCRIPAASPEVCEPAWMKCQRASSARLR
jgi:hypothetical protein